jgi:hypothetical protein
MMDRMRPAWDGRMDEILAIDEIKARYAPDWVLIGEPEIDEFQHLEAGKVLFHSSDREEVYRKAIELWPGNSRFATWARCPKIWRSCYESSVRKGFEPSTYSLGTRQADTTSLRENALRDARLARIARFSRVPYRILYQPRPLPRFLLIPLHFTSPLVCDVVWPIPSLPHLTSRGQVHLIG